MKRLVLVIVCCAALFLPATSAYARVKTKLNVSINKTTCTYDSPAVLKATLTDSKGHPLAKRTLVLQRNGMKVGSYKTDSNGVVSRKVKYLGGAEWRYVFAGTEGHESSSSARKKTTAVTVRKWAYSGTENESGEYSADLSFTLKKGHAYELITNHPAVYFFGRNDENAGLIKQDVSGTRSRFTHESGKTMSYWGQWNWDGVEGTDIRVTVW